MASTAALPRSRPGGVAQSSPVAARPARWRPAGSPEFLTGAGGTNAAFVAEAYRELLRDADNAGSAFWQNALAAGPSRAVAQALIDSIEGVAFQIAGIYNLALGRAPDPPAPSGPRRCAPVTAGSCSPP